MPKVETDLAVEESNESVFWRIVHAEMAAIWIHHDPDDTTAI
ncbi:hypothetical protein [Halothece sp. PCC 7418]|nr:hypothetical protein [Halothece sp. PCC 7418]